MVATETERDEASTPTTPPSNRASRLIGGIAAVGTFAYLIPGAVRGYDEDSGIAVGRFIATRSIGDAFTKTFLFTNQVFFSFLDHLVYSATGSRSPSVMRLLPIALAAIAVGLLASALTKHFGTTAGLAGAAVMATNPLFAVEGSQVRGYSLVVLCAIATTALLLHGMSNANMSRASRIGYAIAGAIGIATHLYMLVVLAAHAIISLRSRRLTSELALPWFAALLGLSAYAGTASNMRIVAKVTGRAFQPTFPRDLAVELLGGSVVAAFVLLAVVFPEAWRARGDWTLRIGAAAVVAAVISIWLIAPTYLYARFFLWLVPVPALAVAAAVSRRKAITVLVFAIVLLQVHTGWPRLTADAYPNRRASQVFTVVTARRHEPCVLNEYAALRLIGYTATFGRLAVLGNRGDCAVLFAIGTLPEFAVRDLDRIFPYHIVLHAQTDGELWSIVPTTCWSTKEPGADCRVPAPTPAG